MLHTIRLIADLNKSIDKRNLIINEIIYSRNSSIENENTVEKLQRDLNKLFSKSEKEIKAILSQKTDSGKHIELIEQIQSQLQKQKNQESALIGLTRKLGFKNQGLIGAMRDRAHWLESNAGTTADLLNLRRHEKDFLLRGEEIYVEKFNSLALQYSLSLTQKELNLLNEYQDYFNEITIIYFKLGKSIERSGYLQDYDAGRNKAEADLQLLSNKVMSDSENLAQNAGNLNLIFVSSLAAFGMLLAFILSGKIRNYVVKLHNQIEQFIKSERNELNLHDLKIPNNEFGKLTLKVFRLMRRIKMDVHLLESRVEKRTEEILIQKDLIEKQHLETIESLVFASHIQKLILPQRFFYDQIFDNVQIYYSPKSLVGGDFYRFHEIKESINNYKYAIIADCTGHGVPGAFLSVLGMNYLNDILGRHYIPPSIVLNLLLKHFERALNHSEDSMKYLSVDVLICCINIDTQELVYSGTNSNGFVCRENETLKFKKTKEMLIGANGKISAIFHDETIQIQTNDHIALFSDGLIDQFGGSKNKKLTRKKLQTLISNLKPAEISPGDRMKQIFEEWKGINEQTDDVTIVSFKALSKSKNELTQKQYHKVLLNQ